MEIDPRIIELSAKMTAEKKKNERKQWIKDHAFDLLNSLIAFAALIISLFGLYLPKG